ncbi:N-6 DNA methylase [Pseudophaeobacter sp.]|uniref:class I SAM-dependent DNA methyltransferase n=1 Tax=Pseudophaeobacter sp. TaxID=1971739 RepID=UPI00329A27F4
MSISSTVKKIWDMCNILRGDGIGYNEYMSELTYLLFLKISKETGAESDLPDGRRWDDLISLEESGILGKYKIMLTHLGEEAKDERVKEIYRFPTTVFNHDENLRAVIEKIDKLDWHSLESDAFGDIYEGLLAKNSQDSRAGAGQYFTPRALVNTIIKVIQPQLGEVIQDPSTGTGGFLISADNYIRDHSSPQKYSRTPPLYEGCEIEKNTYRLCLMNAFLHEMNTNIILGDGLTNDASGLQDKVDVIVANPPFGSKSGSVRKQKSSIKHPSSNKQLDFLQHIYNGLKSDGRAAVVLPDNVLFDEGIGKTIRKELMELCDLHTILRLPTGIFYAAGVKANVLFFNRGNTDKDNTKEVWVYDLRTNMPAFNKGNPLTEKVFGDFIDRFGSLPNGKSKRDDGGDTSRFRKFSRDHLKKRGDNLDIIWLSDERSVDILDLPEPEVVADEIAETLQNALRELEELQGLLDNTSEAHNG